MLQTDSRAALILASFFLSSRMASRLAITYSHSTQPVNSSLPYKQKWALQIELRFSEILIAIGLRKNYRDIGLTQLSDQQHCTSDSPKAIGLTEIYRQRKKEQCFFFSLSSSRIIHVLASFSRVSVKTHELLASILFLHFCSVGVSADANTIVSIALYTETYQTVRQSDYGYRTVIFSAINRNIKYGQSNSITIGLSDTGSCP